MNMKTKPSPEPRTPRLESVLNGLLVATFVGMAAWSAIAPAVAQLIDRV
jgi:hypothetical protein